MSETVLSLPSTERAEPVSARPRHYPALDGMRALAIIGVMALHYLARMPLQQVTGGRYLGEAISYGEYGVDLFFVLSGFLITGILLSSRESPSYFRTFYIRRALRIFPLYYVVLVVLTIVVPLLVPQAADPARGPYMSTGWFWTYLANWPMSISGWAVSPPTMPHFWTLSIEEQFYLVWPAVVLAFPRRRLAVVCAAMVCAAVILRAVLVYRWPELVVIKVNTLCRLDGLVMGAIVATWWSSRPSVETWKRAVAPLLVVVICALVVLRIWRGPFRLEDHATLIIGIPMINAMFAVGIALTLVQNGRGLLNQFLSQDWLRWIGRYSYAIYILHYPVLIGYNALGLTFDRLIAQFHSIALAALVIVVVNATTTILAALITWHVLEQPILKLKDRFPYMNRSQLNSSSTWSSAEVAQG